MTVRRLVVALAVALAALVGLAPAASAGRGACAWVDPYGVCVSNPLTSLPL